MTKHIIAKLHQAKSALVQPVLGDYTRPLYVSSAFQGATDENVRQELIHVAVDKHSADYRAYRSKLDDLKYAIAHYSKLDRALALADAANIVEF